MKVGISNKVVVCNGNIKEPIIHRCGNYYNLYVHTIPRLRCIYSSLIYRRKSLLFDFVSYEMHVHFYFFLFRIIRINRYSGCSSAN